MIDIGTGDGRFVSTAAKANPRKFYIGIDANVKPLEKPSMKATRKPAKGGLPNALFVQAAVEDLPEEMNGIADEVHVHFPWGSLLRAVTIPDEAILRSIRRLAADECLLEVVLGIDPKRDRSEVERLGIPDLSPQYLEGSLFPKYKDAGFESRDYASLKSDEWSKIESSWARKLSGNEQRNVLFMIFQAV